MNEYLTAFQNVTKSVDILLSNKYNSVGIKQSAKSLRKSAQPCIKELEQLATRLKELLQISFNDLEHAEDLGNSKPRIAQAPTHEIWEQLGELTGRYIKIVNLETQCRSQAVQKAINSWSNRVENLKNKWFFDSNKQFRKGIGWVDKDGFIKNIYPEIDSLSQEMSLIVRHNLMLVFQELAAINLEPIQNCISFLDQQTKADFSTQIDLLASEISEIRTKFGNSTDQKLKEFKNTVSPALEALVNQGWGDIYWEQVVKFKNEVSVKIEERIAVIFDDRMKLVTQALTLAIAFYNDFLERQKRYQQETPEQCQAEKAWIDQQRWELMQVHDGVEAILSQTAE